MVVTRSARPVGCGECAPGGLRLLGSPSGRVGSPLWSAYAALGSPSGVWGVVSMGTFTHRQWAVPGIYSPVLHPCAGVPGRTGQFFYFGLTPPAVHGMVVKLHDKG